MAYLAAAGIILGALYAIYRGEGVVSLVKYGLLFGILLPLLYIIVVGILKLIGLLILVGLALLVLYVLVSIVIKLAH